MNNRSDGSGITAVSIEVDGSNRGHKRSEQRVQTYDEAMQEEYDLENLNSVEDNDRLSAFMTTAPSPLTKLDKANAVVHIETQQSPAFNSLFQCLNAFPKKLKGGLDKRMPIPPIKELFWSFVGAFLGILVVSALNEWLTPEIDLPLMVGSFGASAVLIFAVVESKLAQPRNFVGGQVLSAITGVIVRLIIHQPWIASPVGMSLSLIVMQLTSTTHPPGGATALIVCSMTTLPKWAGFSFVVTVFFGSFVMLLVALIVNGAAPHRQYPTFWY